MAANERSVVHGRHQIRVVKTQGDGARLFVDNELLDTTNEASILPVPGGHLVTMVRLISCSLGQLSLNGTHRLSSLAGHRRLGQPQGDTTVGQTVSPQSPFRDALWGLGTESMHLRRFSIVEDTKNVEQRNHGAKPKR
jgi:hypothetical protein